MNADTAWTETLPTAPGTYRWRHSPKWEPIERQVFRGSHGFLCVASHRFNAETPLPAIGGEWFAADLSGGRNDA
jgi:hypothetical protein